MRDGLVDAISGALAVSRELVHPDARLEELMRDSIDAIELVATLEERYGIEIDPGELAGIETVADVDAYIERHGRPANGT
jgi:acyl carrier protein